MVICGDLRYSGRPLQCIALLRSAEYQSVTLISADVLASLYPALVLLLLISMLTIMHLPCVQ